MKEIPSYLLSLPAWGAWIEVFQRSVRRCPYRSLPAWGAWIEVQEMIARQRELTVAPRMGSVDRSLQTGKETKPVIGRSPHGERG